MTDGTPLTVPTFPILAPTSSGHRESLIVLSDVHLGRALTGPPSDDAARKPCAVDADLVRLITHYRRMPCAADRWRLVIAGDFIDFIGMVVQAGETMETELSEEEREHGLGNAADHARAKMQRVAQHHRTVFAALAEFVADGHALAMVHGNHDVEFYWDTVRTEFRAALLEHAMASRGDDLDRDAFLARIEFHPWFFYLDGVAYIEHGHQYDTFCASENMLAPLSPLDPRRIARAFSDILIRYIVRPTRGLKEYGHEKMGVVDYLSFGLELGIGGGIRLGGRFASAVIELFRLRKEYLGEAARLLREEHHKRVALLAEATRIGRDRLEALLALQVPPVTRSIRGILGSVLLDRLALGLLCSLILVVVAAIGIRHGHVLWAGVLVLAAWSLAHRYLASQRRIDPAEQLRERAGHLARLFPAAFVVMGHTHVPVKTPINEGASTYVNLGAWADDEEFEEGAPPELRAPRTHLVIRVGDAGPVGEFLRWDSLEGPQRFLTSAPAAVTPVG